MGNRRPSKRQWRQAWRSWPDGFILLGRTHDGPAGVIDFRIVVANRKAGRLLGSSHSALQGALLGSALPSWRSQGIIERLAMELSIGAGGTFEVASEGARGVRLAIACVGGGRLGVMISPAEAADGAIADAVAGSRPSSSEMIASLSHELRNPLAGLTHALSILTGQEPRDDRLSGARSTALLELARLTSRVDEILGSDEPSEPRESAGRKT